jgi:hypothetical protein
MANKTNTVPSIQPDTDKPTVVDQTANPKSSEANDAQRGAARAAHKAAKTEQEVDQNHTTFSK